MHIERVRKSTTGDWQWQCQCCGDRGQLNELRAKECSYKYPPCKCCGETPECARDCALILTALAGKDIYLSGDKETIKKVQRTKKYIENAGLN